MGKDIKEKYERICTLKERAMSLLEMGMNQDISQIDAKEIGELMDIVKDAEEAIKYAEEACYYHKVTEAMDEGSEEEKKYYLNKYIPEYEGKFYTPMENYARMRDSRGRYMYTEPKMYDDRYDSENNNRMYYSEPKGMHYTNDNMGVHNYMDGKSWESRRGYMEAKESGTDKTKTTKELERYMQDLADDMSEIISSMDSNEKAALKQRLTTIASKIS